MHTYEDGNAPPPEGIIKNKREVIFALFERRACEWISLQEIRSELERHGLSVSEVTARISDIRDELYPEGFMIDARSSDLAKGQWEYKLATITPEYEKTYLARRKSNSQENPSVIAALEKKVKELESKLAQAPKPVMDTDLSLGEWDEAYEAWYAKREGIR